MGVTPAVAESAGGAEAAGGAADTGGTARVLYASGSLGFNVLQQTLALWLVYFYAPPPDSGRATVVPLGLLGLLMGASRIVEAVDDPLIGHWSDVTRSPWGRRLPFVVAGTPFLVITFVLLWLPPATGLPWTAVYFLVVLHLYSLAATVVQQPHDAALAEIARTTPDRVRVSSLKVAFGLAGAAVGLVGSGVVAGALGFPAMAVAFALLAGTSILVSAAGLRRLPATGTAAGLSAWAALRLTATNRQFLVFVGSTLLFYLGLNLLTQAIPYYVTVVLGGPEEAVSLFTALFAAVALAGVPLVNRLVARGTKAGAYRLAMGALAVLLPGLALVGLVPGLPPLVQGAIYVGLLGLPMAALFVLPNPILADVVDEDALRTGMRREGIYFAAAGTLNKMGFAVSTVIFGALLSAFGFSAAQPLGVRLVGPVAGLGMLAGVILFARAYRLPDRVPASPYTHEQS
jgi:glycoside/pentoside/hexuronide:cation symporter, GPH family